MQYTYDALNRLIAASTAAASDAVTTPWGQGFGYDGFGNLTAKSVTKGSAPVMSVAVNPLTNRITGNYDANGNLLSLPAGGTGTYDAENRLVAVPGATYGYDGGNKRIWRWTGSVDTYGFGNASGLQLYMYGLDGKQLGAYVTSIYTNTGVQMAPLLLDSVGTLNVYFRGKKVWTGQPGALVAFRQDRLGSSVKTYPYGEEKVPTGADGWKVATYLRDTATNLDYADQRFYANTQGRFMSPDPYVASGGASDPASWNRYAYVGGDPINRTDPKGLYWCSELDRNVESSEDCYDPSLPNRNPFPGGPTPPTIEAQGQTVGPLTFYNWGNSDPQFQNVLTGLLDFVAKNVDSDCSKWLLTGTSGNPLTNQPFESIAEVADLLYGQNMIGYAVVFGSDPKAVNNASTGSGVGGFAIVFNLRGSTFERGAPRSSGDTFNRQITNINPGSQRAGLFTMIHELAHFLNVPGFRSDANSRSAGNLNNDDVWKNCQKTIGAGKNR